MCGCIEVARQGGARLLADLHKPNGCAVVTGSNARPGENQRLYRRCRLNHSAPSPEQSASQCRGGPAAAQGAT
eukprot:593317-Pyramimonas_sp.AAC.1